MNKLVCPAYSKCREGNRAGLSRNGEPRGRGPTRWCSQGRPPEEVPLELWLEHAWGAAIEELGRGDPRWKGQQAQGPRGVTNWKKTRRKQGSGSG